MFEALPEEERNLLAQVSDWKGHCLRNWGRLLLSRHARITSSMPTGSPMSRMQCVFLFENLFLAANYSSQKDGHGGSLVIKGRTFLRDVTEVCVSGMYSTYR